MKKKLVIEGELSISMSYMDWVSLLLETSKLSGTLYSSKKYLKKHILWNLLIKNKGIERTKIRITIEPVKERKK